MKIAIVTPILYDDTSPFNHLFKDIIDGFLTAGHKVVRLVAVRNIEEDDFKLGYENIEYIKFRRKESGRSNIVLRYLRDTLTNFREAIALKKTDADVLFEDVSYSSFLTVKAAKKKGMRVVAMLQDVWPDNAVQSGLIKKTGLLYRYFELWQLYVYKNADKLICISDDMKAFIVSKGIDESKIEVIYNWGYSDDIVSISWENNKFARHNKLSRDIFYVIYAGNIGKMQNVELVVETARILQKNSSIQFLIVGDGANVEHVKNMAIGMNNISFLPFQSSEMALHIYSAAGVNIIPLVHNGITTALPSKTGVVLSCGKPALFCFGEGTKFEKKLGGYSNIFVCSSNSASDVAQMIIMIRNDSLKADYSAFNDTFKSTNAQLYTQVINSVVHGL